MLRIVPHTQSRSPLGQILASGILALAFAIAGCGDSGDRDQGVSCLDPSPPGTVSRFATDIGPSEGIAFLDDSLFVSGGDGMRRIDAQGQSTRFTHVPSTIGMTVWKDALYVASQSDGTSPAAFCAPTNQGTIWRVTADGSASVFARGFISPNFVLPTPWDTLLVSDDCVGQKIIYEVDASGTVTPWNDDVVSANGMAFHPNGDSLFVINTFVRVPSFFRIPVLPDRSSGTAEVVQNLPTGSTPDGLAMDAEGNAYAALNILGILRQIAPDGTATDFATGLETPASMAFGQGAGFDPCSMYVTSLTGQHLSRVTVGRPGVRLGPAN